MRRFIEIAARVAGELFEAFIKELVDIEGTRHYRPIGAINGVGRIDRLHHKAITNAQALVGRLKFRAEIRHCAIMAAHAVEALQQRSGGRQLRSGSGLWNTGERFSGELVMSRSFWK